MNRGLLKFNVALFALFSGVIFLFLDFKGNGTAIGLIVLSIPIVAAMLFRAGPPTAFVFPPACAGTVLCLVHNAGSHLIAILSAASLVWGYDIIAGIVVRRMTEHEREMEIRAQKAIIRANEVREREFWSQPRKAAE